MKSNYKRLGNYISSVDVRNRNLENTNLIGLSIQKVFIPSISNTIGTDMSTYRIINHNQFAYCPVTSRNGEKITIALYEKERTAMISQAYNVFETSNTKDLLPEYLMMWFRRPEFDRYARFISHGSVREMFSWEDLCEVKLPVPSPEKQKEIVKEYHTIINRIDLNNQLIHKLEETAQAIYKQWFVEFEFPDDNGKPYKSSGGKMVESELGEIPKGWRAGCLHDLYKFQYGMGNVNPDNGGKYPVYGSNGAIGGFDTFNNEDAPVIGHIGENCGSVVFAFGKHFVTYNGVMCNIQNDFNKYYGYCALLNSNLKSQTRGSSQTFVSYDMLYEVKIVLPNENIKSKTHYLFNPLFENIRHLIKENELLETMKDLLLSKIATI